MPDKPQSNTGAPIPGSSLTKPMGSHPAQKPAMMTDPAEALEYSWDKISEMAGEIYQRTKRGGPTQPIARTLNLVGVQKGLWSKDTGDMIADVQHAMIIAIHRKMSGGGIPTINADDFDGKEFARSFNKPESLIDADITDPRNSMNTEGTSGLPEAPEEDLNPDNVPDPFAEGIIGTIDKGEY